MIKRVAIDYGEFSAMAPYKERLWNKDATDNNDRTEIRYSFDVGARTQEKPYYASAITKMDLRSRDYVRHGFSLWQHATNVRFREGYSNTTFTIQNFIQSSDDIPSLRNKIVLGYTDYFTSGTASYVGINIEVSTNDSRAELLSTLLHEQAHVLGFIHRFSLSHSDTNTPKTYTSYSVTNYVNEVVRFNGRKLELVPITPMIFDINMARTIYGSNPLTGLGDDVYDLNQLMYAWPMAHGARYYEKHYYATISTFPWDNAGVDTLDASKLAGNAVINLRTRTRSQVDNGINDVHFFEMPDIAIENVVGCPNHNTITLNELDNVVSVCSAASAIIIIDPLNTGTDTIICFNPEHDLIEFERIPCDESGNFDQFAIKYLEDNSTSSYKTIIHFNQNNKLVLQHVKPDELKLSNFLLPDNQPIFETQLPQRSHSHLESIVDKPPTQFKATHGTNRASLFFTAEPLAFNALNQSHLDTLLPSFIFNAANALPAIGHSNHSGFVDSANNYAASFMLAVVAFRGLNSIVCSAVHAIEGFSW